jgi:enterochelin esterase-like enzyme
VVCPYLPKEIGSNDLTYDAYASWLGDVLLPKVRAETPALPDVKATGIDGVSLGGITALRIGLARADLFGVVGALQPAVNDLDVAEALADDVAAKLAGRPLRIVTSKEDAYRTTLEGLHAKLDTRKVPHEFFVSEGPHDYLWNKGPGGYEMVVWHDRAQRR